MTHGLVICSYKYGHLAAHAIETALDQRRKFDKIWFVDDGAMDCTHLPELYPEIEYVLRTKNLGTVDNFQDMLMNKVDTDYVMFLGADNWLRNDTLYELAEYGTDIVMYDIMVVGDRKDEIHHRHPGETHETPEGLYWHRQGGHHGSMLYNVKAAKNIGGYKSPPGRSLEDMHLYNAILNSGGSIAHVEQAFLYYRRHRENYNPC